jgi:hypothetical protein
MNSEGRGSRPLVRYRFRTAALAGPWRETREAALKDAVKAGQAYADEAQRDGVRWKLPATIEAEGRGAGPKMTENS